MADTGLEVMLGVTMSSVTRDANDEELIFTAEDGRKFIFYHEQDCCESVSIEDVCGDLDDLVGSPLTQAEETVNDDGDVKDEDYGSATWTFYKFSTVKGSVTVRWYGSSNGYYSESVDFRIV